MPFFIIIGLFFILNSVNADNLPAYDVTSCPSTFPQRSICGVISFFEDRHKKTGKIDLTVIRLQPAIATTTPAVILGGGGPGGGLSLNHAEAIRFWEDFRQNILPNGELVLIDQRGAGLSQPLLNCPNLKNDIPSLLARPLTPETEDSLIIAKLRKCQHRFQAIGVNIAAYTTENSAADIEETRQMLKIPTWKLIGFSYGARLAMDVMRHYPDGVQAALLDSLPPFDANKLSPAFTFASAISRIAKDCNRQQHCRRHNDVLPNLHKAWRLLENTTPTVSVNLYGISHNIALTPTRLLGIIQSGLYYETGIAALPMFARQLAEGDFDTNNMEYFLRTYYDIILDNEWAELLNIHINCQEEILATHAVATHWLEQAEQLSQQRFREACNNLWESSASQQPAVDTTIPILIVGGIYDPVTPTQWATTVAARLPNAQILTLFAGHTPSISFPCLQHSIRDFFAKLPTTVKNYCHDMPPLTFF